MQIDGAQGSKTDLLGKISKNFEMQFKGMAQNQQEKKLDLVAKLSNNFAERFQVKKQEIHLDF